MLLLNPSPDASRNKANPILRKDRFPKGFCLPLLHKSYYQYSALPSVMPGAFMLSNMFFKIFFKIFQCTLQWLYSPGSQRTKCIAGTKPITMLFKQINVFFSSFTFFHAQ